MKQRTIILGIDGIPFNFMEKCAKKNIMPNFAELKKQGIFKHMMSSIPEISSASWSSIITGKNPGEHGIYGFMEIIPGTYSLSFPNFNNLKSPPFWSKQNKKYVIINVPTTYPVKKLNGFIVSGFVSLDLEKSVYPISYYEKLKKMNYQIDIDAHKAHKSKLFLFNDLFKTLEKRIELYKYLWDKINWDVFMFVITGSDRLGHFLWNAYENKNHEYHEKFLDFFRKVDEITGDINKKLTENDTFTILSDHGMELSEINVNINQFLVDQKFLVKGSDPNKRYNNIKKGTKAFALDPGRIYLNKKNKYPNGSVEKNQEKKIIENIINKFENFKKNGKKIIKNIHRRDNIYSGKCLKNAPDIVLTPNKGFNLKGNITNENLFDNDDLSGMHNQDAFLFVKSNKNISMGKNVKVDDFVNILNL